MSNKYAYIQTAAELDRAIRDVSHEQKRLGKDLGRDTRRLQQSYSPSGLYHRYTSFVSWSGIALGLVRGLKRVIRGK